MACRYCQVETLRNVCQLCEALISVKVSSGPRCLQCNVPLEREGQLRRFCQLCNTMFETVRSSRWFSAAQAEWDQENYELAKRKRALLGTAEEEQDLFTG